MRATLGLQPDDIAVQGAPGSHGPANTGAKSPLVSPAPEFREAPRLDWCPEGSDGQIGKMAWWAESPGLAAGCNFKLCLCGAWTGEMLFFLPARKVDL